MVVLFSGGFVATNCTNIANGELGLFAFVLFAVFAANGVSDGESADFAEWTRCSVAETKTSSFVLFVAFRIFVIQKDNSMNPP